METWQTSNENMTKAQPINKTAVIDRKILYSKLDHSKKLQCTNERRIMEKFKTNKNKDRRISLHISNRSGKGSIDANRTITYGTVQ